LPLDSLGQLIQADIKLAPIDSARLNQPG